MVIELDKGKINANRCWRGVRTTRLNKNVFSLIKKEARGPSEQHQMSIRIRYELIYKHSLILLIYKTTDCVLERVADNSKYIRKNYLLYS